MELILINDTKLKIMLTREDMTRYDLDCASADYDSTETRRAFWSILDEAKHRTGFDAARDRVFIQLYPSREGGCEMFVTKVGMLCAGERQASLCAAPEELAYVFDGFDTLLGCCRMISAEYAAVAEKYITRQSKPKSGPPSRHSTAYADEGGQWYLFLTPLDNDDSRRLSCILTEFGTPVNARHLRLYISEHGKEISDGSAVSRLASL